MKKDKGPCLVYFVLNIIQERFFFCGGGRGRRKRNRKKAIATQANGISKPKL